MRKPWDTRRDKQGSTGRCPRDFPLFRIDREAPVRFGSVTVWRWNGSSGSGFRFRRFLCKKGFFCISVQFNRKGRFRFWFRFPENGSGGSGSAFGFGKNGSY